MAILVLAALLNLGLMSIPGSGLAVARYQAADVMALANQTQWSFDDVAEGALPDRLFGLARNAYFLAALAIYLALSFLWVWLLRFTPLSRAYLFVALSFAIVPLLGGVLFAEPISLRLVIGVIVIVCGLVLVVA